MPQAEARRALNLPQGKKLILFVGDPARTEKRFWLAEKTVSLLPNEFNAQIIVAHGVPPREMPLYMNACDALLVTSSTEGSPNAVKEALACDLPIVSTDVGDIRKRTEKIEGCEVCNSDTSETLASALARVLYLPHRVNSRKAAESFDEKILLQKTIQMYRGMTQ
jgi:glycosyltransferase involved in cell wall biosynthesis